jgi:hypothetical protein
VSCHWHAFTKRGLAYFYASTFYQGTVCVPPEHGYEAWENKDNIQNNDQKDSDHGDKNCIGDYHEDTNTTEKSRP